MTILIRHQQWLIAGFLLAFMILTRAHLVDHLQDASWAIFFLAGFYLRSYLSFPLLWLSAFAIDLIVIEYQGVSNFCFTPAYPFLIPAYAALWLSGRWLAKQDRNDLNFHYFFLLFSAVMVGTTISFLISNGGFYIFSGRFSELNMTAYLESVFKYFPLYLETTLIYVSVAALGHIAVHQTYQALKTTQHE